MTECRHYYFAEPEQQIFFSTGGEGVKSFRPKTSTVSTVKGNNEILYGITYDTIRNKLYWTSSFKIYRALVDGTEVETVLQTQQCKILIPVSHFVVFGEVRFVMRF